MTKEEAISWFGSQNKLAAFLGVYQSNVSGWKNIPQHHQAKIQEHTKNELIAEDSGKIVRYGCFIEIEYIDMLREIAGDLDCPVVEVLRKAIKEYTKKISQKKN